MDVVSKLGADHVRVRQEYCAETIAFVQAAQTSLTDSGYSILGAWTDHVAKLPLDTSPESNPEIKSILITVWAYPAIKTAWDKLAAYNARIHLSE